MREKQYDLLTSMGYCRICTLGLTMKDVGGKLSSKSRQWFFEQEAL